MADIQGSADPRFDQLHDVLSASIDRGDDVGASVSVTIEGETVVDLWGGWTDEAKTKLWQADTITNVWSTTKTMTSLSALVVADRGDLDLDAPVATYWPEFAANGKEAITVKQLMGHTSGVSGWAQPVEVEDLYDWEKSTSMLAAQEPWWEPGSASGYHALNQGHLVGEVIRRITGKKLGEFFADEIAGPLDIDFHIGLDPAHDDRVANVIPPPPLPFDLESMDPDSPAVKTMTGPAPSAETAWTAEWRRADIGAANGHGNARSVARAQALIANGGEVDGVRLLSPATIARIFDVQADGIDVVLGEQLKFGIGYGLKSATSAYLPDGNLCFWGGWGGSSIVVDTDRRVTFAYMMNRMAEGVLGDPRSVNLFEATYKALDQ
ncbi:MAG: beta-lactamase family protein [Acidimicrobiia bacterium]|nr:beta-lactamase family protein [Acidimicrobiia bacterium]